MSRGRTREEDTFLLIRCKELEQRLAAAEAFIKHMDMSYRWAEWCDGRVPPKIGEDTQAEADA